MVAVSTNLQVRDLVAALDAVRAARPRVHVLVGPDVAPTVARVLAAVGAQDAAAAEVPGAAGGPGSSGSAAVLVGLGSLDEDGVRAAVTSAHAARERGDRWVLDPDTASGPAGLARSALQVLAARPAVIRATAAEVMSLGGCGGAVDGPESIERAFFVAGDLARRTGAVVAISGEVDLVTDGERAVRLPGGDAGVARLPGIGTALAALVTAYVAVVDDPLLAATAAHAHAAVAAGSASAPSGSSSADGAERFAEALARVDGAALERGAQLV